MKLLWRNDSNILMEYVVNAQKVEIWWQNEKKYVACKRIFGTYILGLNAISSIA